MSSFADAELKLEAGPDRSPSLQLNGSIVDPKLVQAYLEDPVFAISIVEELNRNERIWAEP